MTQCMGNRCVILSMCDHCLMVYSTGGSSVLKAAGSQVEAARK